MRYFGLIILFFSLNITHGQSSLTTVEGTHTLTQSNGMGLYEAIDLCLRTAIKNGLIDYVQSNYDISEEESPRIMILLDQSVEMCVQEPEIVQQTINGNEFTIKGRGKVDPMLISLILGLE